VVSLNTAEYNNPCRVLRDTPETGDRNRDGNSVDGYPSSGSNRCYAENSESSTRGVLFIVS
jgi:hypothetical protein